MIDMIKNCQFWRLILNISNNNFINLVDNYLTILGTIAVIHSIKYRREFHPKIYRRELRRESWGKKRMHSEKENVAIWKRNNVREGGR